MAVVCLLTAMKIAWAYLVNESLPIKLMMATAMTMMTMVPEVGAGAVAAAAEAVEAVRTSKPTTALHRRPPK